MISDDIYTDIVQLRRQQGKRIVELPKQEYASLSSAIKTRWGNSIPAIGDILFRNHYYVYNYSKQIDKLVCILRVPILDNEERIIAYQRRFDNETE